MFPDYKKKTEKFLWRTINSFKPDGWENLGMIRNVETLMTAGGNRYYPTPEQCHKFCGNIWRLGRENNKIFRFCPLCLVKDKVKE